MNLVVISGKRVSRYEGRVCTARGDAERPLTAEEIEWFRSAPLREVLGHIKDRGDAA